MFIQKVLSFFMSIVMFFSAWSVCGNYTREQAESIAANEFAQAGRKLTRLMLDKCYNPLGHKMRAATDNKDVPYVWSAAAFIEAMADAYRLFPSDLKIKTDYTDALTKALGKYLVKSASVDTGDGAITGLSYYNASAGNSDDYYYDDNEWVCIQLLIGYRQLGKSELLAAAEENLRFLWTGWDDALGGGIYWSKDRQSKNACSNAPAAIAYLLAYQITGKDEYLEKGRMIYDWQNGRLRDGDLFIDNVTVADGRESAWKGLYNQATMIYAGSLLYEITGEEKYYDLTCATVHATLPHAFTESETGDTVMNGNPIFKAWCVGWLARSYVKFYEVDPRRDTAAMDKMCAVMRGEIKTEDARGLYDPFFLSGDSDPENRTELLAQCGVASAFLNCAYYDVLLKEAE